MPMKDDRPKPPRPTPPSEPTLRSSRTSDPSIRAAGLERPRAKSDPHIANTQLEKHELQRHGKALEEHEKKLDTHDDTIRAMRMHMERSERQQQTILRAMRLEEPPDARERNGSDRPSAPGRSKRPPKPALTSIEVNAMRAKFAAYAGAAFGLLEFLWKHLEAAWNHFFPHGGP